MNLTPRTRFWLASTAGLIGIAFIATVLTAGKAPAQEVYVGVHGGKSMGSTELTNTPGTFSLDGIGSQGYVGGVHGGVDLRLPSSPIFAGIFAGYDWGQTEFALTVGSNSIKMSTGDAWYVGGRAGVLIGGSKVYALTAFREATWSSSIKNLTLADPKGFDLGVGAEIAIAKNVSLGIEGIRTQFQKDEFMFGAVPVATGVHAQTDVVSVMARLNFQFGNFPTGSIFDDRVPAPAAKGCDKKLGNC